MEALKQPFEDNELRAILYSNAAAAEYHLQNYRSALKDCIFSRKFNKNNLKAILKGNREWPMFKYFKKHLFLK